VIAAETTAGQVLAAARQLRDATGSMVFAAPVAFTYNPVAYAWCGYQAYVERYVSGHVDALFVGMNPGPFGMAQTGVPFGDVGMVSEWLGVECAVGQPPRQHPNRPIAGFRCDRREVSGQRLWGLFRDRFSVPQEFFRHHFVVNYCPLLFMEESGRNRTPDKLPRQERDFLQDACDAHLRGVCVALRPRWLIGIGAFAAARVTSCLQGLATDAGKSAPQPARILHPSPASPAANRGWAALATAELQAAGIW
jgi:single-strand selective monofunctional uracil DNA glycosylase